MSRSRNWVEKLRNNFQEEEIIFKTCNHRFDTYLYVEENRFRSWLLTNQSDDPSRMYPNKAIRNFYIHDLDVHNQLKITYENDYVSLLHLIIFEMERLNGIVNKLSSADCSQ